MLEFCVFWYGVYVFFGCGIKYYKGRVLGHIRGKGKKKIIKGVKRIDEFYFDDSICSKVG